MTLMNIPDTPVSYHFLQLLYTEEEARSEAYGCELRFIPVNGSPELGFAHAAREPSNYIVYRAKSMHATGKPGERMCAIDLVLTTPKETSLESVVELEMVYISERREVTHAELLLTAVANYFTGGNKRLIRLEHDLNSFVKGNELLTPDISSPVQSGHWANSLSNALFGNGNTWEYELDATIRGQIAPVLGVYDFLQKENMKYKNCAVAFS